MDKIIEFYSNDWSDLTIVIKYMRGSFRIFIKELSEINQSLLRIHDPLEYSIIGKGILRKGNLLTEQIQLEFVKSDRPVQLLTAKVEPLEYVTYTYQYDSKLMVQRNGFMIYAAPTGQGKTYFALQNISNLARQCDTILYINYELSVSDLVNRLNDYGIKIPSNVYAAPLESVAQIKAWAKGRGRIGFIIDNIDNLVGAGDDAFGLQLEFMKGLDRFLKDENHHALVLTQLVKENSINLLGKDGMINDAITTNILSGVKQLSYLARTVFMTAYSPNLNNGTGAYDYKVLKLGSGKVVGR